MIKRKHLLYFVVFILVSMLFVSCDDKQKEPEKEKHNFAEKGICTICGGVFYRMTVFRKCLLSRKSKSNLHKAHFAKTSED